MAPSPSPEPAPAPHDEATSIAEYFRASVPTDWFTEPPRVRVDREEILVVGTLSDDTGVQAFREHTRASRVRIATVAENRWARAVSWAARQGDAEHRFTTVSVPVMTRLRIDEREVLDILIEAGVARSRSEALAWCVRLVGQNEEAWLAELVDAMAAVRAVRAKGPQPS